MGLIHIMERGGEDVNRFESALYDAKEAIMEICETFESMKSQFSERGGGYGERSYNRYGSRYGRRYGRREDYEAPQSNHIRAL